MINYMFRNNPYTHPVLSEITRGLKFRKIKVLGINFFINLDSDSEFICIDDPLVILALKSNKNYKKYNIVFYSLEIYERQVLNNTIYNILRNTGFYIANYMCQRDAHTIIFPSKLRLNYFKHRSFIIHKSHIIYNKPDFLDIEIGQLEDSAREWINKEKQNGQDIIVFAGSIGTGRNIDLIIDNLKESSNFSLVLAGKIRNERLYKKIEKSQRVLYIGEIPRQDVFALYAEADFGLLNYDNNPKNSELCAPIKIWEYYHFGLRIMGNENVALLNEWSPLIHFFYKHNNIEELLPVPKTSSELQGSLSITKSFSKLVKTLTL